MKNAFKKKNWLQGKLFAQQTASRSWDRTLEVFQQDNNRITAATVT